MGDPPGGMLADWERKLLESAREIVRHGHGQLSLSSTVIAGSRRKVIVEAGREYVFFVEPTLTSAPAAP